MYIMNKAKLITFLIYRQSSLVIIMKKMLKVWFIQIYFDPYKYHKLIYIKKGKNNYQHGFEIFILIISFIISIDLISKTMHLFIIKIFIFFFTIFLSFLSIHVVLDNFVSFI